MHGCNALNKLFFTASAPLPVRNLEMTQPGGPSSTATTAKSAILTWNSRPNTVYGKITFHILKAQCHHLISLRVTMVGTEDLSYLTGVFGDRWYKSLAWSEPCFAVHPLQEGFVPC